MKEEVDHLQWKKYLTSCNERSSWPAAMKEEVDQLQWNK